MSSKIEELRFSLEEVTWGEVRETVFKHNQELAEICDRINPDKKYPLFRIKYPYGAKIVDRGIFNIPTVDNQLIPIKDSRVPVSITSKLDYCSIPLSLILHNNNEVYVESSNRVIPLNFFKVGDVFGIFENMNWLAGTNSDPIWTVTAGARSVFMIPKITDRMGHARIKREFGVINDIPTDLIDHWGIFSKIAQHAGGTGVWYNEVLVFSRSWFEGTGKDSIWLEFRNYLFKTSWKQSKLLRDAVEFGLLWASFSEAVSNRSLKPRAYIVDTLKHLISIGNGSGVAFKPATDELSMPLSLIQKVYTDVYNLKTYMPTVMQPCKLNGCDHKAYYSLSFPTTLETSPYMRNAPSLIEDQRDIKTLLDILLKTIKDKTTVINPIKGVSYEFFHTDIDKYGQIHNSKDILKGDDRFNKSVVIKLKDRVFCGTSHFFRGCMRISSINN